MQPLSARRSGSSLSFTKKTLNTHYFSTYGDKFLTFYKGARDEDGIVDQLWNPESVQRAIASLAEIGINTQPEDLPRLLSAGPIEAAITIMASVRAYFQGERMVNAERQLLTLHTVAYKRFVDTVFMTVDYELIRGLERGLDKALREGLQLTGADAFERCAAMLQEPANVAMKRQGSWRD